ncbi:MAG TPA: hypothetical protein VIJ47_00425, partial [Acidimicrobiales bacterium]
MTRPARTRLAAAAGIVVGLVVAALVIVGAGIGGRAAPKPKPDATVEFIAAFQRSLGATFVAKADFTRVLDDGRTLESAAFTAQRPPDRIQRQFGGITGTVAGSQIMCSTTVDGQFHCGPAAPAGDPNASLAKQLQNLQSYFADPALYRVVEGDPGCFELTQVRPLPLAPYGSSATMCFDEATGAIRYLEQRLEGAIDTYKAVEIRGFATDQDFSLAQDNTYDSTSGGERADLGIPPSDTSVTTG